MDMWQQHSSRWRGGWICGSSIAAAGQTRGAVEAAIAVPLAKTGAGGRVG